jgi:hypothetical protein
MRKVAGAMGHALMEVESQKEKVKLVHVFRKKY